MTDQNYRKPTEVEEALIRKEWDLSPSAAIYVRALKDDPEKLYVIAETYGKKGVEDGAKPYQGK